MPAPKRPLLLQLAPLIAPTGTTRVVSRGHFAVLRRGQAAYAVPLTVFQSDRKALDQRSPSRIQILPPRNRRGPRQGFPHASTSHTASPLMSGEAVAWE